MAGFIKGERGATTAHRTQSAWLKRHSPREPDYDFKTTDDDE